MTRVSEIQQTLPEGVKLRVVRDAGVRVEHSVSDVETALLEGALLTVLVVFLFLNSWRSTVITGLALPVSVLASFIAVWAFGFTLNTMSLLGLSLAIGILIDDAIVVRENIVRHMEMGKDHCTAAREGTAEIGLAVAATTFSIVVVFVPIAFMGGLAEQWFKPFALTIACSVLVSLFVSFSLDPMLSAYWPDPEADGQHRVMAGAASWTASTTGSTARPTATSGVIGWALRPPAGHDRALPRPSFVGALAMPAVGLVGSAFFPQQDSSEFNVELETPPGSNLEYTRLKAEEAASAARAHGRRWPTPTPPSAARRARSTQATVYVRLVPKAERARHQEEIANALRDELTTHRRAHAPRLAPAASAPQADPAPAARPGHRLAERSWPTRIAARCAQVPGAVDVGLSTKGEKPELEVELDRGLASSLGITVGQVAQALRPAFAGIDAGDWVDPQGETRDVTVRLRPNRASIEA